MEYKFHCDVKQNFHNYILAEIVHWFAFVKAEPDCKNFQHVLCVAARSSITKVLVWLVTKLFGEESKCYTFFSMQVKVNMMQKDNYLQKHHIIIFIYTYIVMLH